MSEIKKMGRPILYTEDSRVYLYSGGGTKLHPHGDRRAIVNRLVDNGGSMTLGEIDAAFGFNIRERVFALQRAGWLRIEPAAERNEK